jgi:hypothetical protein
MKNKEIRKDNDDDLEDEPEKVNLILPSYLGKEECERLGLEKVVEEEMELRRGEAEDFLADLRLALGHKALLLRTRVRKSKSQFTKTRSWDLVHSIDVTVNRCMRGYARARQAMMGLGAEGETLQEVTKAHLDISKDVVEENRFGQKNDTLAWFWRQDNGGKDKEDNWMQECEY